MNRFKIDAVRAGFCILALLCSPAFPAVADVPGGSKYLPALTENPFPAVAAPAEPFIPRWNFSKGEEYRLRWRQETETRLGFSSTTPERSKITLGSSQGRGDIVLRGNGGFADLILKDHRTRTVFRTEEGGLPKTVEQTFPPSVLQGIQEDGTLPSPRDRDLALQLLFRLPPRGLVLGEPVDIPITVPFAAHGSLLQVAGVLRTTLTDFVEVEGRPCARLATEITIGPTTVPGDVPGRYSFEAIGSAVLFFDLEEGRLLSGRIALRLRTLIETALSPSVVDGVLRTDRPEQKVTEADADTLILLESF